MARDLIEPFLTAEAGLTKSSLRTSLIVRLDNAIKKEQSPEQQKALEAVRAALAKEQQERPAGAIVESARRGLEALMRPTDVGCAMSLLTHGETSKAFGYLIAKEYIAVQVVVRNLNRDQEFILHDVEFAVNADPMGRLGRFYSGRDKVIVRTLSSQQQTLDPRNLTVNLAKGVGALLSAMTPIFSSIIPGVAVYNGAFIPTLDKVWKDQTTEQLNLLNDIGFSSSSSAQTVVPKSSSVMFVTFVPAKPYTEGWWTLPCANLVYVGTTKPAGGKVVSGSKIPGAGVNVGSALEICIENLSNLEGYSQQKKKKWYSSKTSIDPSDSGSPLELKDRLCESSDGADKCIDLFRIAHPVSYNKWSATTNAIFRELSAVAVSGIHVVMDRELAQSVSQLKCPTDSNGNVTFAQGDTLACTLTGKNLEKIAKIRLRNSRDPSDPAVVEGTVTVSGDSSNASVVFPVQGLRSLSAPDYTAFGVSASGLERTTGQALHFSLDPVIMRLAPVEAVDFGAAPVTVTLEGYHLRGIAKMRLSHDGVDPVTVTPPLGVSTDTSASFAVDPKSPGMANLLRYDLLGVALLDSKERVFAADAKLKNKFPTIIVTAEVVDGKTKLTIDCMYKRDNLAEGTLVITGKNGDTPVAPKDLETKPGSDAFSAKVDKLADGDYSITITPKDKPPIKSRPFSIKDGKIAPNN